MDKKNIKLVAIIMACVIIIDQITKAIVATTIPLYGIGTSIFGDFFRIIHVRNNAVAFSLGSNFSPTLKFILFIVLPIIVLSLLVIYTLKVKSISKLERSALALIAGGGFGNIIDRIFRPSGVVDFLDVKFYGLFGFERWPTFNIADSCVVVGVILMLIAILLEKKNEQKS